MLALLFAQAVEDCPVCFRPGCQQRRQQPAASVPGSLRVVRSSAQVGDCDQVSVEALEPRFEDSERYSAAGQELKEPGARFGLVAVVAGAGCVLPAVAASSDPWADVVYLVRGLVAVCAGVCAERFLPVRGVDGQAAAQWLQDRPPGVLGNRLVPVAH